MSKISRFSISTLFSPIYFPFHSLILQTFSHSLSLSVSLSVTYTRSLSLFLFFSFSLKLFTSLFLPLSHCCVFNSLMISLSLSLSLTLSLSLSHILSLSFSPICFIKVHLCLSKSEYRPLTDDCRQKAKRRSNNPDKICLVVVFV